MISEPKNLFVINIQSPNVRSTPFAYILAGGKSSRMGTDKGLLLLQGEPLIQRIIQPLQTVFNRVVIVSNNPAYRDFGLEVIPDKISGLGPAGGIQTALHHTSSDKVFIVSCDMPFISSEGVEFMLSNAGTSQISLPLYKGRIEPLFGAYSKGCLTKWDILIDSKITKLKEMVECFDLSKINVGSNPVFSDLFFTNVNSKDDFNVALKYLHHEN